MFRHSERVVTFAYNLYLQPYTQLSSGLALSRVGPYKPHLRNGNIMRRTAAEIAGWCAWEYAYSPVICTPCRDILAITWSRVVSVYVQGSENPEHHQDLAHWYIDTHVFIRLDPNHKWKNDLFFLIVLYRQISGYSIHIGFSLTKVLRFYQWNERLCIVQYNYLIVTLQHTNMDLVRSIL